MKRYHILEKVAAIIVDHLGGRAELITDDTEFAYDLCAETWDLGEIALSLEEEFSVNLYLYEKMYGLEFGTVGNLVDYIEENT